MDEFDLIRRYFAPLATGEGAFGLADDVAELIAPVSGRLIVTTDAIVENVHFLSGDPLDTVAGKLHIFIGVIVPGFKTVAGAVGFNVGAGSVQKRPQ